MCSGIEAATVAWHSLGWDPVAYSEIEPFPSAVLKYRHPAVPNWGDMTQFQEWSDADVNLLVGGTPCQSFSVAGLRKGLDDPRGNLALVYLALADRYRPDWLVWENVPGVLSSNGGRDFGAFVGGLGQLGYGWAYRILDAQYLGVAQRRRRVFVVGCLGGWQRAAAVLFERESMRGTSAPRRADGQGSTAGVIKGAAIGRKPENGPQYGDALADGSCYTLTTGEVHAVCVDQEIRHLTPRECERLQGFPDDYTLIPCQGKPAADGPRYKALGNSMAVPVMHWIGSRIAMVRNVIGNDDGARPCAFDSAACQDG